MPGSRSTILVTGATGFIGSHLVRRLLADGHEVHVLVRDGSNAARLTELWPRLIRWTGDLTDPASLARCCRAARLEVIYSISGDTTGRRVDAGWDALDRAARVNFLGLQSLVRAAAEAGGPLRCFIRLGGLGEYGNGRVPYQESQREMPQTPYAASQVAATHWCQMLQQRLDFTLATLRPALVYGPAQSAAFLIPAIITALLRRQRFPLTQGSQRRDLLHVDDLVVALLAAAQCDGLRGAVVNIATNEAHAIRDVALQIARTLDAEALLDVGGTPARPGDTDDLLGSNALAARLLGWRPMIGLAEGLSRTIDWYRREAALG